MNIYDISTNKKHKINIFMSKNSFFSSYCTKFSDNIIISFLCISKNFNKYTIREKNKVIKVLYFNI